MVEIFNCLIHKLLLSNETVMYASTKNFSLCLKYNSVKPSSGSTKVKLPSSHK